MCIVFGGNNVPIAQVKNTKLFIAPLADGKQLTIYENQVSLQSQTAVEGSAMILPVPAGKIQLLDLSAYSKSIQSDIFVNLKKAFPEVKVVPLTELMSAARSLKMTRSLVVKEIGSYFVSIAPRLEDIAAIDPVTFRVPQDIQKVLAENYGDGSWGFVICRFRSAEVRPHPIGYIHERLQDGNMFVPTRHAHGSENDHVSVRSWITRMFQAAEHNDWDHELYFWGCEDTMQLTDRQGSVVEAGETPEVMMARLRQQRSKAPPDGNFLSEGQDVVQSVSLLGHMLDRNGSANLMMPHVGGGSQQASGLARALRFREIKPAAYYRGHSRDLFAFQPAQFGGLGLAMPNADLILTVARDMQAALPEPATNNERMDAVASMRHEWVNEQQTESQCPEADSLDSLWGFLACKRRRQANGSSEPHLDSLV